LGFVNWLFLKRYPNRSWVLGVIAFHHKDIGFKYRGDKKASVTDPDQLAVIEFLTTRITRSNICAAFSLSDCCFVLHHIFTHTCEVLPVSSVICTGLSIFQLRTYP